MGSDKWSDDTYCNYVWYGNCSEDAVNGVRHQCVEGPHITGSHTCACGATHP